MPSPHRRLRPAAAFTLVELLVASTLGALLMVAAATLAGSFSQSVATLMEDVAPEHETALARMARDVRYAWWTDVPSADRLIVDDHQSRRTVYRIDGTEIIARHPDGEEGVLAEGVGSLSFQAITMQRLREGPQVTENTIIAATSPVYADMKAVVIGDGASQAVGFVIDSVVGERSVTSVDEQVVGATIESIALPLAQGTGKGTVTFEIYPAWAPGNGRPRPGANSLGSVTFPLSAFSPAVQDHPHHPHHVTDILKDQYGVKLEVPDPRGGLFGLLRLNVDTQADLTEVLDKFDLLEIESGFDVSTTDRYEETGFFLPSVSTVNLDTAGAFPTLVPGVAYTLVMSISGNGSLAVVTTDKVSASQSTVAARENATKSLVAEDYQFAVTLSGTRTITSTIASDEVALVRMDLQTSGGQRASRAAGVFSQVVAEDPWMGVVEGDPPPEP